MKLWFSDHPHWRLLAVVATLVALGCGATSLALAIDSRMSRRRDRREADGSDFDDFARDALALARCCEYDCGGDRCQVWTCEDREFLEFIGVAPDGRPL